MDDEIQNDEDGGDDMGVVTLMLGLYLIILAFFILLNAISEDSAEKRDIVVESVQEGFDFQDEGDLLGPDDTEITAIPAYNLVQEAITGVIQTYLSFQEYDVQIKGQRMFVSMDIRRFFRHGEVTLIPEMILFFEDLGRILSRKGVGIEIHTNLLARTDESDIAPNSTPLVTSGLRSSLFTRALLEQGVQSKLLSSGAVKETPRLIMLFDILVLDPAKASEAQAALEELTGDMAIGEKGEGDELSEESNTEPSENPTEGENAQTLPE